MISKKKFLKHLNYMFEKRVLTKLVQKVKYTYRARFREYFAYSFRRIKYQKIRLKILKFIFGIDGLLLLTVLELR